MIIKSSSEEDETSVHGAASKRQCDHKEEAKRDRTSEDHVADDAADDANPHWKLLKDDDFQQTVAIHANGKAHDQADPADDNPGRALQHVSNMSADQEQQTPSSLHKLAGTGGA